MDEVFIRIQGRLHYLRRAVDQNGVVLDILVQSRRSTRAAKREILPGVEHRQSRYLNYRPEMSHQPTRRRKRPMQRFEPARHAQRFLSAQSRIHNHFQFRRHRLTADQHRAARDAAFRTWSAAAGVAAAA